MSGVAGGNRIAKADVEKTYEGYVKQILEKIPGFKKATLSGSVKVGAKADYGDLDIVTWFEGEDKREVKQRIIKLVTSQPDSLIVPFRSEKYLNRKYYNSGEIITILFPVAGKSNQYIQIDNIIALTEEEHDFKNNFLDLPAEKQGLMLGLAKVITLEENINSILKRLKITDVASLEKDEEYEFNISSSRLSLRKVKLDNFREVQREELWSTTNWGEVEKLLIDYKINGNFEDLLKDLETKLKNPRSRNRVKGIFNSMVSVKSGEVGTPKGTGKEKALNAVNTVLEQNQKEVVALYGGGFKPPHKAHFNNVKFLSDKADKIVIFIGPKVREGIKISATQSKSIWEVYKKYFKIPVELIISEKTPVRDIYEFADNNAELYSKIITGALPEEMGKFAYFVKNKENYPNLEIQELPRIGEQENKFSASTIRSSKNYLRKGDWIPKEVSSEDKEKIIGLAMQNTPSEKEIQMEEALEKTLAELFAVESKPENKQKNEGSSGTAIAPQGVIRSEDRAKLVRVYGRIINLIGDNYYDIAFNGDHIIVKNKHEGNRPSFDYTPYMSSILEYMIDEGMKILPLPEVKIKRDIVESSNFFGKTAYYDPNKKEVVLYVEGRHPKDVIRSFTHEMIHHKQNMEGRLGDISTTNTNEDSQLMEIEKEAYLEGNMTFRNWEDIQKNLG